MKIKNAFIKYNMLCKLIITMVILICLPMLIIGWVVVDRTRSNLERQNMELQLNNTSSFLQYFNSQRAEMVSTAVRLGYEQKLTPDLIEEHPYNEIEAMDLLSYYKLATPIANKMFVYYLGKVYVLGSEEKYNKKIFINAYSGSDPDIARNIENMLDQTSDRQVVYVSNLGHAGKEPMLQGMFVCVRITSMTKNDAVVVFYLNNNSLNTSFLGALNSKYYELYIYDNNGNLMLTNKTGQNAALLTKDFKDFIADKNADSTDMKLNGEVYDIFKRYDENSGLSFVMIVPQSDIDQPIKAFSRVLQFTIIAVAIISLIMLTSAVYLNYRPILELLKRIRDTEKEAASAGEIKTINLVLDRRNNEKALLTGLLSEQKLMLTNYMLKSLLNGETVAQSEINNAGIELYGPFFCAIAASGIVLKSADEIKLAERTLLECGCHISVTSSLNGEALIFICDLPQGGRPAMEKLTETIVNLLPEGAANQDYRFGVGSCEDGLNRIRNSYLTALIAIDQGENRKIVFYEEAVSGFNSLDKYPSEEVLRFMQCVKHGEKDSAVAEFEDIVDLVSKSQTSAVVKKYIYQDIVNQFIKSVSKLGISLPEQNIDRIISFRNSESLKREMAAMILGVCDEIICRKTTSEKQLADNVRRYIDENYRDANMNLPMVADSFKMSIYTLSGLINESFGMGFREYIVNKRIEESKILLLEMDDSIKDIAAKVGFNDVSYYIRSFKKLCGITPNKYKQINGAQ